MKKKNQIMFAIGTTSVSVGATLGVYFAVQNSKTFSLKTFNFGEKYFKKNILNDKNYLYNEIAFTENGENLGFLNRFEMLHYNNSKNKEFLKKDPKNNLLNKNRIIIDYSSKLSKTQIKNIYLKINKKLSNEINKIKKINGIGDLGIEFVKEIDKSIVEIKIFEIKSFNQDENALIDDFINDLGIIKKRKNGWTPNNFFRMYTSEVKFRNHMLEQFNFDISSDYYDKWEDVELGSHNNGKFLVEIRDSKIVRKYSGPKDKLFFVKKLAENNIIPTVTPLVDWKNKKSKILFKFFKTTDSDAANNLDKSIITNGSKTYLWNSRAIRSKIFEYDLTEFSNTNPTKGNREENAEIIKKFFIGDTSFPIWTNKKIITIGLSIFNEQIPSLSIFSKKLLFLGKIFSKKEDGSDNLKYASIFEDEITLEINGNWKTGKLQELILDILEEDDIADVDGFVDVLKQFISKTKTPLKNEIFDENTLYLSNFNDWSNFKKMSNMDYKNGGIYKFFKLHGAFNAFYDYVLKALENKFGNLFFEEENLNIVKTLFDFLKEKNLIDSNVFVNELISNYKEIFPNILEKIAKNNISVPKKIIETLLSLFSIPTISENLKLITNNIYDLFNNNKFSLIWEILGKTDEIRKQTIVNLLSENTRIEAINNILKNNNLKKESIKILLDFLNDSKLLPSFLNPLRNEDNLEIMHKFFTGVINGSTSGEKISDFLKKSLKQGFASVTLNEFKNIFKIIVKIYKKQFDGLKTILDPTTNGVGNLSWEDVDSDVLATKIHNFILNGLGGNQSNANASIEGILSLIKLFINNVPKTLGQEGDKDDTKWFDSKGLTIAFKKFFNSSINSLGVPSYKTIFKLIFKDMSKIENIGKKLGLTKVMAPRIRNFLAEISNKFLNQGVTDLNVIKTIYNNFINDANNLDIKKTLHTFVNNKIISKEKKLKTKKYLDEHLNPLTDDWQTWGKKYIPKLAVSGYTSPQDENIIHSILDMNLIDFVVVFSLNNDLDPIELATMDNETTNSINLKTRLNLSSFSDWKLYYGSIFDSFKRFYDEDGEIVKTTLGNDNSNKFKNYNFIDKFKNLFNKNVKDIINLLLNIQTISNNKLTKKLIINKLFKTTISILKTGFSTTKIEWKTHIKNIINFMKDSTPLINKLSKKFSIVKTINDKYILSIVELFEIGEKQNDGNFTFINPDDNSTGSKKIEEVATAFSNLFNKSINNFNSSKNFTKNDLKYAWKLLRFFLIKKDNDGNDIIKLPKDTPEIIENILIDKVSFSKFTTVGIKQLISIINSLSPNTKIIFNLIDFYLNQFIIGKNKS